MSRLQQQKESLHNDSGMPLRKRRAESFFGLHFDFHADPKSCPDPIGLTLKEEDIRTICRELRPDFIQIDCKGHPGWVSYPTKIGNAMPAFCGDPLRLWRDVTASEGVAATRTSPPSSLNLRVSFPFLPARRCASLRMTPTAYLS